MMILVNILNKPYNIIFRKLSSYIDFHNQTRTNCSQDCILQYIGCKSCRFLVNSLMVEYQVPSSKVEQFMKSDRCRHKLHSFWILRKFSQRTVFRIRNLWLELFEWYRHFHLIEMDLKPDFQQL